MMRFSLHMLLALATWAILVGGGASAAAQSIDVDVRTISASKSGDSFDSNLDDLKAKLEKVFGSYSSFEQVGRDSAQLDKDETESIDLAGDHTLKMTFHGIADGLIKIGIEVADKLSTTIRASSGSTFFQAGLDYEDGILILAITVEK